MSRPLPDERPSRVVIEGVRPLVDGGRFPVKRTIGETVEVSADVLADGHDRLAGVVRYRLADAPLSHRDSGQRAPDSGHRTPDSALRQAQGAVSSPNGGRDYDWHEVPIEDVGNDRWRASFRVQALGRYEFTLQAWIDRFGSWREELTKKHTAGQDVASELLEGAEMIRDAARHASRGPDTADGGALVQAPARPEEFPLSPGEDPQRWLLRQAELISSDLPVADRVAIALSPRLAVVMARHADRRGASTYDRIAPVVVERERARYGAWYEMFPRSAGTDPSRAATFDEAARRLPAIAALGFDVVYLPPVHPIGRSFRKGRNNALIAQAGDPGSPWAIGSPSGGHMAVDPALGGIDAFDRFVETAAHLGLEIALDLALQASPDHPYVRSHPEWFRHRPDGSIKYAENPPKKYQDIYPIDFETAHWKTLWSEVLDVVFFWIGHGVRVFRVDNPHTKPFRFWQWLIADVRRARPDVIFLAEAFTRPKVMRLLAKAGFSQSYSYFTWRNTKTEIEEYFRELARTDVREYMRPNLFANTPDILSEYLQRGGRPAFQVRLILAATLGASYGIYSGFELCENLAVAGTEEYVDSEKYEIRVRDWDQPGNIKELVARVNEIRRENVALHSDWSLEFHETDNGQIVAYSKRSEDGRNTMLMVVNLDPFSMQHGWVRVPVGDWAIPPGQPYQLRDLLTDEVFQWRGDWNYVRLEPGVRPAHVFRLEHQ